MTNYPMTVEKISWEHKGGTKSYHMVRIVGSDERAVLLKRWGKTGSFGQTMPLIGTKNVVDEEIDKLERAKRANGYIVNNSWSTATAFNETELKKALGIAIVPKLGAKAFIHLDPNFDITGMREVEEPDFDENGNKVPRSPRIPVVTDAERQALADAEKKAEQDLVKTHPLFGMFG